MELKPGYKQTEVGVIPVEWEVKSVCQLGQIKTGPFGTLLKASEYSGTEGVPLISVGEVGAGSFKVTEHTPLVPAEVVRRLPQYILRTGDIVFGRKGSVERSALVSEKENGWFLGSDGISIRPLRECHPPYLSCQFQRYEVQMWLLQHATGTTMASLNQSILGRVQIPYAPLPEQRAIAEALSDVDGLLGGLDRLIAKKRDLKQAAMQQLLTGQTRIPGFDGEWEVKTLSESARFCSGTYLAQDAYRDGPFEVQGAGNPMGKHVAANFAEPVSVIGRVGTVGRPRFMRFGCWVNNNAGAIVAIPGEATPSFVHLLLLTIDWSKATSVTAQPFLVIESLMTMEFRFPPLPEQTAIAAVLSDMDAELVVLEERREKTRLVKQGMMQELLTGRTRLV